MGIHADNNIVISLANDHCMTHIKHNSDIVCKCRVNYNNGKWSISSWFTDKEYQHKGLGKKALEVALQTIYKVTGKPDSIEYIWNGTNSYVGDWITKHFDAKCKCPLVVLKETFNDDWESHIYELNVDKVLKYFNI